MKTQSEREKAHAQLSCTSEIPCLRNKMSQHAVSAAKQDYLMSKAQDTCTASRARGKASSMEDSLWLRHQAKSNLVGESYKRREVMQG